MVGVRYVLTRRHPSASRILVVESGSRHVLERLLPALDRNYPSLQQIDILTCHPGIPESFDPARGRVFRVQDYRGASARRRLFRELKNRRPDICGLLCTGAPIMTAWKWLAAWRMPSKIFLVNENSDYFWLDRGHWRILLNFAMQRAGLGSGDALSQIGGALLLPLTLTFLLLYAAQVHFRRWLRTA
jgi:hypothetical protein